MDDGVPRVQLKRVDPFLGLMIDAETWRDSHDYHRQAEYVHALSLHGWGIVSGLEVDPADPADRSVWIRPGVAIDPEGRLIIVAQPFHYQLNTQEPGVVFLVLMFREIPTQPMLSIEDGRERPSRILEAYAILERDRLPDQPHVELARILLSSGRKAVRAAGNPTAPKPEEIDTRYREQGAIRPGPRVTLGVWKLGSAPDKITPHLAGPTRLLQEVTSGVEWRVRRRDEPGGDDPIDCDLLIMPVYEQFEPDESERRHLTAFLDSGGVILAESCVSAASELGKKTGPLAQALNRQPAPVNRDHPLLTAKHTFSAVPAGAGGTGRVLEGNGLILSQVDYCCAWNGGAADRGMERAEIRNAVEFAENLLAYAITRRGEARRTQRTEQRR